MIYEERHPFQNSILSWVAPVWIAWAIWQIILMWGAETGLWILTLGYSIHLVSLIMPAAVWLWARRSGFRFRVSLQGWTLQAHSWGKQSYCIRWEEIRHIRFPDAFDQLVETGCGQSITSFISNPSYTRVQIELTNGNIVFVSIRRPGELRHFLHSYLFQAELRRKVLGCV